MKSVPCTQEISETFLGFTKYGIAAFYILFY